MQRTTRLVLATIMTAFMVFMVTLVVTFINLGLPSDFLSQWGKAYVIAWPIAATTGFLIMPMAQRLTATVMKRVGKTP